MTQPTEPDPIELQGNRDRPLSFEDPEEGIEAADVADRLDEDPEDQKNLTDQ